jgi:glycosyltransferase involved in cell wall biosynthesis
MKYAVAVIQPCIPHYRAPFFAGLRHYCDCNVFCLNSPEKSREAGFSVAASTPGRRIGYRCLWRFAFFNPLPLLNRKYKIWVLMASPWQMSNYLLMALAPLLGRRTILWGQGIDVSHYLDYERAMPAIWRWMYRCCSGAWFYTSKEQALWARLLPGMASVALGNTLASPESVPVRLSKSKSADLREKYGVTTPFNFLFCARIDVRRRMDLLLKAIEYFDPARFGFLIIGDGADKPDFSRYSNVHAFGAVYDPEMKDELFSLADVYFQPAWLGLSVVEALQHALPVLTFSRAEDRLQGVEFHYIAAADCGRVAEDFSELKRIMAETSLEEWRLMGERGARYIREELSMVQMVERSRRFMDCLLQTESEA